MCQFSDRDKIITEYVSIWYNKRVPSPKVLVDISMDVKDRYYVKKKFNYN